MGGCSVELLPERRRPLTEDDIESEEIVPWEKLLAGRAMEPAIKVNKKFGKDMFLTGAVSFGVESLSHVEGMERSLIDMIDRPDFVERMLARKVEVAIQQAMAFAKAGMDALYIGETFGQFMSPEQFRRFCLPNYQKLVEELRPHGILIYFHMCGRATHLLELLVETGVDCVEPLDEVGGTPVAEVYRRIGGRVALMGGVNTTLLARGTVDQVREDCARCIREAGRNGGYILAAGDMLPSETSPEKVRAMVECVKNIGSYKE